MSVRLSAVIPSWKDPLLIKTISSLLENSELGDSLEVIAVFDGYYPEFTLLQDPRVRYVHLGKNRGMRGAINAGVEVARGEFLLRTDEHCVFCKGYDKILTDSCQSNWIMTAKRFFLDPVEWKVMDLPPVEHEKLVIQGGVKFAGQRWPERDLEMKDTPISETMAMQGSMWVMPHEWWTKVIGELQTEGYGPLIQDSHEMIFKTWKAGGKMMLNKNAWYAHKHRSFSRTHNNGTAENPANCDSGYAYALKVWEPYYTQVIRPAWNI
ncbi:MAG: glycosyltransferase [Candidatus Izemoplasmatales bacterium]